MTCLASRLGADNIVRHDRPLTNDELEKYIPSVFSDDKYDLDRKDISLLLLYWINYGRKDLSRSLTVRRTCIILIIATSINICHACTIVTLLKVDEMEILALTLQAQRYSILTAMNINRFPSINSWQSMP